MHQTPHLKASRIVSSQVSPVPVTFAAAITSGDETACAATGVAANTAAQAGVTATSWRLLCAAPAAEQGEAQLMARFEVSELI